MPVLLDLLRLALATQVTSAAPGEWPLPAHDNHLSARAEVPCRMPTAPQEAWAYDLGQVPCGWATCADVNDDGQEEVLWGPAPLVCMDLQGNRQWRSPCGGVVAIADLDGDGATEIVVDGPAVVSGRGGQVLWTRAGTGYTGLHRVHVGKFLPEVRGLQIACVSEQYELNQAQMWSFEQGAGQGRLVWEREFNQGPVYAHATSSAGPFDRETMCVAAAVHGGLVALNARDGQDLFRFYWQATPAEGIVRNYGALAVRDLEGDGRSEFAILNDLIAVQLGVFAPAHGGAGAAADQNQPFPSPEFALGDLVTAPEGPLLWRRFFGEWYPQGETTLHVPPTALAGVDGDGRVEIVVSVHRARWELQVYDALTGEAKLVVPDLYVHAALDLDGCGACEVLAAREPSRTPREFTELVVGSARDGRWAERFRRRQCRLEVSNTPLWPLGFAGRNLDPRSPVTVSGEPGLQVVVTEDSTGDGRPDRLLRLGGAPGETLTGPSLDVDPDLEVRVLAAGQGVLVVTATDATVRVLGLDGQVRASWSCGRPLTSGVAVADLDGGGGNEVVVCRAGRQVVGLRPPAPGQSAPEELWSAAGWGVPAPLHYGPAALVADLNGDGRPEVLTACLTDAGGVGVQLLDGNGRRLWRAALPGAVDTPLYQAIERATVGDFDGDGRLDVYVAARMAITGNDAAQSFVLRGTDGALLWQNDGSDPRIWHHTLGPTGLPAVADVNGDGADDVLFVTLDLCCELSGRDGSFLYEPLIANAIWQQANQSTQWTAYGTQLPVDLNGDGRLEVLECAAWGQWGAWTMDRALLWTFDPGRDEHAPRHPGIADVDGDGQLELGVLHNGGIFRCYEAATGKLKWELKPVRQWTDVVTADVDGDGAPEFLAGGGALGAIKAANGQSGQVLWEATCPAAVYSPVVADVDGDGLGEIIVGCSDGKVRAFR